MVKKFTTGIIIIKRLLWIFLGKISNFRKSMNIYKRTRFNTRLLCTQNFIDTQANHCTLYVAPWHVRIVVDVAASFVCTVCMGQCDIQIFFLHRYQWLYMILWIYSDPLVRMCTQFIDAWRKPSKCKLTYTNLSNIMQHEYRKRFTKIHLSLRWLHE